MFLQYLGYREFKFTHDDLIKLLTEAVVENDITFLDACNNEYPELVSVVVCKEMLLIKAFSAKSIDAFTWIVDNVSCPSKLRQLDTVKGAIKERLKSLDTSTKDELQKDLDIATTFTNEELENELIRSLSDSRWVTIHVLLFRAFLRANNFEPYDYLSNAKTDREKELCIEIISTS